MRGSAWKCLEVPGIGFENLDGFDRRVLWNLPCEPNGLSLHELADGLLGYRGPRDLALVRESLRRIHEIVGLSVRCGDDEFGHAAVNLYGISHDQMPTVRRLAASVGAYAPE